MATRKKSQPVEKRNPTLLVSRAEATEKIEAQIQKGRKFMDMEITSLPSLTEAQEARSKWRAFTKGLLEHLFDDDSIAREFDWASVQGLVMIGETPLYRKIEDFRTDSRKYVFSLESIHERLILFKEPAHLLTTTEQTISPKVQPDLKKVFIVHGHDNEAKETVARFTEKLRLDAIILHEQPNGGRTIIEKLEKNASDVAFAIVLLTPDDIGHPKDHHDQAKFRARQNVILELGYFMGLLGRDRVVGLVKPGIEIPTDFQGVSYIEIDPAGAWRLVLAREIKSAGISIDLNDAM